MFFSVGKYYKVFNSIIRLISVNMMNHFSVIKRPTKMFFSNYSMFQKVAFLWIIESFRIYQYNVTLRINTFAHIIPSFWANILSFKGFRYLSFLFLAHRPNWFSFKEKTNTFFRTVFRSFLFIWHYLKSVSAIYTLYIYKISNSFFTTKWSTHIFTSIKRATFSDFERTVKFLRLLMAHVLYIAKPFSQSRLSISQMEV